MVTRYGMDERLGHATYEIDRPTFLGPVPTGELRVLSEETNRSIDEAVREIVNAAFERALELLEAQRATLEAGALTLLQQETLEQKDLEQLQATLPVAAARSTPANG